jgi:hypothetical protein
LNLTIIAAFSFLLHFGFVGAMYSDWMDPVINDDLSAGLLEMVQKTVPPPVETVEEPTTPSATATETATSAPKEAPKTPTNSAADKAARAAADVKAANALLNEADQARIAILGALNGGPNINGAMKDDNGAAVDLNSLANRQGGISNTGGNGLNLPGGAGGPIHPGGSHDLASLHGGETGGASTSAGVATKVVPVGSMDLGASAATVPVANAEAVIRSQIGPGAKRCYQRGLETDPSQAGKLVIAIKVAPSGEVDTVSTSSNSGLSSQVESCIKGVARRAKFDPPGAAGSTLSVPFNFLKQGG